MTYIGRLIVIGTLMAAPACHSIHGPEAHMPMTEFAGKQYDLGCVEGDWLPGSAPHALLTVREDGCTYSEIMRNDDGSKYVTIHFDDRGCDAKDVTVRLPMHLGTRTATPQEENQVRRGIDRVRQGQATLLRLLK